MTARLLKGGMHLQLAMKIIDVEITLLQGVFSRHQRFLQLKARRCSFEGRKISAAKELSLAVWQVGVEQKAMPYSINEVRHHALNIAYALKFQQHEYVSAVYHTNTTLTTFIRLV